MKRLSSDQNGIGHLAALAIVVTLAIVGAVGYRVVKGSPTVTTTANYSASTKAASTKNTASIDATTKALDATDVNGSVDPSQFDADVNNLL